MLDLEPDVLADLIGAWSLDEGSGLATEDGSTFNHDGKLVNGPAWIAGVLGKALRFDGVDDRVEIAGFDPPDQGTLTFWAKPDAIGKVQRFLGSNDAFEVRLNADGRIGHDLAAAGTDVLNGATALKAGAWQHVALTWNRSSEVQQIYIDGQLDASKTGGADDDPGGAQTLSLGRRTGTTPYFKGALDEVMVFDRVLTAAEIADLAVAPEPTNQPPVASNDTATTQQNTPVKIAVLANDTDSDGSVVTARLLSNPANGSAAVDSQGAITYTPAAGFTGSDSFTYAAVDDDGAASAPATVAVTVKAASPQQGPIGAWSLDEGTGVATEDGSTFNHDGKLVNGPAWIDGVLGKALRFDGVNDRVEIAGFDPPNQGTLTFWAKPDAIGNPQRFLGSNDAFEVRLNADGRIGHDLAAAGTDVLNGATALKAGAWQHVALTWNRSSEVQQIYLDGRLDASKTGSADDDPGGAQTLSLGRRTGTTPYFKGALDEVLVFDRVLSAAEIADLASGVEEDGPVFPGDAWLTRTPEAMGLDPAALAAFRQATGNQTGFIVKDGFQVYSWGNPAAQIEWASASKPVHSTMLLFALDEGKVSSVDQSIGDFGWALRPEDSGITFRTLANMTSGYALPERPGEAWGYNDYAIDLYVKTLYDRAFGTSANAAATAPDRLGALDFQDGGILDSTASARVGYGLQTSARDFARIGWFWLNEGQWQNEQLIPSAYFDSYWRAQVPDDLPRTVGGLDDYLKVGTYGGGTDQTSYGPGSYGMNLWHNVDSQLWPDAPADTYQANGHWNGEVMTVIPSLGLVAAWKGKAATPETFGPAMNDLLRQLSAAAGPLV